MDSGDYTYVWQAADWPNWRYDLTVLAGSLAEVSRAQHEEAVGDLDHLDVPRARQWVERNSLAFLEGYLSVTGATPDQVLLRAYQADKAVYEVLYETRNRPDWVSVPLAALERLTSTGGRP